MNASMNEEWRWNLDNCSSPDLNMIKVPEIPTSVYEMGYLSVNLPLISCLFIMPLNLVIFTSSTVV